MTTKYWLTDGLTRGFFRSKLSSLPTLLHPLEGRWCHGSSYIQPANSSLYIQPANSSSYIQPAISIYELNGKWLTNFCRINNLMNWHWRVFPLSSSFPFPSSFLSDHSDPLKRFYILINCQLPAAVNIHTTRLHFSVWSDVPEHWRHEEKHNYIVGEDCFGRL